jgi:PncC family amidohydrolase
LNGPAGELELSNLVALGERIQQICLRRSLTVASAESCTGGLVGYALTEVAGSSGYYLGGVISYGNDAKREQLGVPATTLEMHGAVSAQTAVAMAEGARQRFAADFAVAVTGVAGPGGGTDAKPVGLVYMAVADAEGHAVQRQLRHGDRHANRLESARACLELLLERLEPL